MKKIITICLLLAATLTTQAQTEQETISWLQEKLSKYIVGDQDRTHIKVSVTSCGFVINYIVDNDKRQMTFPLNQIDFNVDGISTVGERITLQDIKKQTSKNFMQKTNQFILKEGETDLRVRVKKVMEHLNTFCPKKKETF